MESPFFWGGLTFSWFPKRSSASWFPWPLELDASSAFSAWLLKFWFLMVISSMRWLHWDELAFIATVWPHTNWMMGRQVGLSCRYCLSSQWRIRSPGIITGFSSLYWISTLVEILIMAPKNGMTRGLGCESACSWERNGHGTTRNTCCFHGNLSVAKIWLLTKKHGCEWPCWL